MEKDPTIVPVVAAAIRDRRGRLLLQQCLPHKPHAGLWEFPGGKAEIGEIPRLALCREIDEELGLTLDAEDLEPCGFADETPDGGRAGLVLLLYTCSSWTGEPTAREGQEWGWFALEEAFALALPPMDRRLLEGLSG